MDMYEHIESSSRETSHEGKLNFLKDSSRTVLSM